MKRLILLFLLIFTFSCEPPYKYYYTRSFVLSYTGVGRMTLTNSSGNKMHFILDLRYTFWWGIDSEGDNKIRYDYLCEKHGDVTYNRKVAVYVQVFNTRCAEDFVSCEITSTADWDAEHPAGSSLGDLVRFQSDTPLPYVRSGYTQKYSEGKDGEYYPIDKLVSELLPDDMTMLPSKIFLRFTTPPTLSLEHTLTVRLTTDEGKVFTASVDAVF